MGKKYKCAKCGAAGCKLWREYQSFHIDLRCAPCAGKDQGRDVSSMDENGMRLSPEYDWSGGRRTASIGWYVPAVSDGKGNFWGYTSVTPEDAEKWRKLPTFPKGYKPS